MIIKLFCPKCAHESAKSPANKIEINVPVPITQLSDDGVHEVICANGHHSLVTLNNAKFEVLFEMGINSLVDKNSKEAVASFISALERFYEFYWRVVMVHFNVPEEAINSAWKTLSKQSERQLGSYIAASLMLNGQAPTLLTTKETEFRNRVIHGGYIPKEHEAIRFGDVVKKLISNELTALQRASSESLKKVYKGLLPRISKEVEQKLTEDEIVGGVNIITTLDALNPINSDDPRSGNIIDQFNRILTEREPHRMLLFKGADELDSHIANYSYDSKSTQAILYSGNNCISINAPLGWMIEPGNKGVVLAWLYQAGIDLNTAIERGEFMYINFWDRKNNEDLDNVIKTQESFILEHSPNTTFEYKNTISRADAKTMLRIQKNDKNALPEYTSFAEFKEFIFYCVLICPRGSESINLKRLEDIMLNIKADKLSNQVKI